MCGSIKLGVQNTHEWTLLSDSRLNLGFDVKKYFLECHMDS